MAQADSSSTTRRNFVRLAASAAIVQPGVVAMAAAASTTAAAADPIFAAIERVKAAEADVVAACEEVGRLEELLPRNKRLSDNHGAGETIEDTDDPRWIACVHNYRVVFDVVDECSVKLLDVRPTTIAGIVALLRYAHQYVAGGREWPQHVLEDGQTDEDFGLDFSVVLHNHVADAIEALVAAGDL